MYVCMYVCMCVCMFLYITLSADRTEKCSSSTSIDIGSVSYRNVGVLFDTQKFVYGST